MTRKELIKALNKLILSPIAEDTIEVWYESDEYIDLVENVKIEDNRIILS